MYRLWLLYCQAEVLLLRQGLESRQEPGVLLLQDEGMCCRAGELGLEVQHLQGVMRAGQGGGGEVSRVWGSLCVTTSIIEASSPAQHSSISLLA